MDPLEKLRMLAATARDEFVPTPDVSARVMRTLERITSETAEPLWVEWLPEAVVATLAAACAMLGFWAWQTLANPWTEWLQALPEGWMI